MTNAQLRPNSLKTKEASGTKLKQELKVPFSVATNPDPVCVSATYEDLWSRGGLDWWIKRLPNVLYLLVFWWFVSLSINYLFYCLPSCCLDFKPFCNTILFKQKFKKKKMQKKIPPRLKCCTDHGTVTVTRPFICNLCSTQCSNPLVLERSRYIMPQAGIIPGQEPKFRLLLFLSKWRKSPSVPGTIFWPQNNPARE